MAIRLGRPLPTASRDLPEGQCENPPAARNRRPFLFGLAPGGVYPATPVAGGAVRSYRTLSPLPPDPGRNLHAPAVCFLWHFPWGCPRRALPGTVFPWSPDFPPLAGFPIARSSHPAIRRQIIIGPKQPPLKAVKNWKRHTYRQCPAANRACQDQRARALRTGGSGVEMRQVKGRSLLCRSR